MNLLPYIKERICKAVIGVVSEELTVRDVFSDVQIGEHLRANAHDITPSSVFTAEQMLEDIDDDEIARYLESQGYFVAVEDDFQHITHYLTSNGFSVEEEE